jgi:hypothetical protein
MASRNTLKRRKPHRLPKPRFLVVCEGKVTEPDYFRDLRHSERCLLDLVIEVGGTPKSVVEKAVDKKKDAERAAKRESDPFLRYDVVWCVFDIDEHPNIREAKQQAADNNISVAISNPCFELWALLHFQDQTGYIDRAQVQRLCRTHMPGYEKKLDYAQLEARYAQAFDRAVRLDKWHGTRGTNGDNPSTAVYVLVEKIRQYSRKV